jgi:hypothetical protein
VCVPSSSSLPPLLLLLLISVSPTVQNAFWIHPCSWQTAFSKSTTRIKRRRRIHPCSSLTALSKSTKEIKRRGGGGGYLISGWQITFNKSITE